MSSDDYFDDLSLDDAALRELDAIEAAHLSPQKPKPAAKNTPDDSFDDVAFDINDDMLAMLDEFSQGASKGATKSASTPPSSRTGRKTLVQTTLFGDIVRAESSSKSTHSHRSTYVAQEPRKTKVWDRTEFAKTGFRVRRTKSAGRGKQKAHDDDEDFDNEELEFEFEQFPAPQVSGHRVRLLLCFRILISTPLNSPLNSPPPPMKQIPDLTAAKYWIYPTNKEKRNYQYNIAKNCLFENTIVALPTGVGKTFIAGVVMLNFYRWFPQGKVVFVAPTKPLVAQQVSACHDFCGIDGSDAAEMTGQIPRQNRRILWQEKRVLYMTPQTLINDLVKEECDVRDIVLLVVDEAHRATGGDYAYNQVVRFMMAKNPHFRLLALTATPGSTPDAVQRVVDGLHISRIEIRDEDSPDLKPYIYEKKIEKHIINMNESIKRIQQLLAALMNTCIAPAKASGCYHDNSDPCRMKAFRLQSLAKDVVKRHYPASFALRITSVLAQAMGYLIEGTIEMCYKTLKKCVEDQTSSLKKRMSEKLRSMAQYRTLMTEIERQQKSGFATHPKMERLKALLLQHFADSDDGPSKAMVFVSLRETVEEIVETLGMERPIIRASKFVGQGIDAEGRKGMTQKVQIEVIKQFKADEFNVLVATSIGEEGLDIGEVDLIVCYDAPKTPIRMLQRLGRTGRKRKGAIHILLAAEREEMNFDVAKDAYKQVQKTVWQGVDLEFYADVERLLPDDVSPSCVEQCMEIRPYNGAEPIKSSKGSTKGTKRKRNDDIGRNIPLGASTGFVSAGALVPKGSKKAKPLPKDFDLAGEDDEVDMDIESGTITAQRQLASSTAPISKRSKVPKQIKNTDSSKHIKSKRHASILQSNKGGVLPNSAVSMKSVSPDSTPANPTAKPAADNDMQGSSGWLIDDDDDDDIEIISSPVVSHTNHSTVVDSPQSEHNACDSDRSIDIEIVDRPSLNGQNAPSPTAPTPESSFSVRPARRATKGKIAEIAENSEPASHCRIYRLPQIPTKLDHAHQKGRGKRKLIDRKDNPLFDYAAEHSGDEVSEGSSGEDDAVESESDRRFLEPLPETQLPLSYDQSQIYRQSLLTQAVGSVFASKPNRRGMFGRDASPRTLRPTSSSPPRQSDEYELGTFVVDDDAEISYLDDSSEL